MYEIDLEGKNAFVFGVANQRSIAWHIASVLDQAGARVALSYLNDRIRPGVERLASRSLIGSAAYCVRRERRCLGRERF